MASSAASGGPLLRLAANGKAVAATAGPLGPSSAAAAPSRRFFQGLDWPADVARLEGGCHAGHEDGELAAAVAPAAHAARLA
jgi:hypothetical protein